MSILSHNVPRAHVNKEILRAVAASGSSLNHPEIHRLALQMHQQDNLKNLKLWVHRDLVKTRDSSGTLYVPTAYDISSNDNDAVQATTANQPKLVSTGMEFTQHRLTCAIPTCLTIAGTFTIMVWVKYTANDLGPILASRGSTNRFGLRLSTVGGLSFYNGSTWYSRGIDVLSTTDFNHVCFTYDNTTINAYKNGALSNDNTTNVSVGNVVSNFDIGYRSAIAMWDGIINDIRVYDKILSATEISAIYNETKSFYGL